MQAEDGEAVKLRPPVGAVEGLGGEPALLEEVEQVGLLVKGDAWGRVSRGPAHGVLEEPARVGVLEGVAREVAVVPEGDTPAAAATGSRDHGLAGVPAGAADHHGGGIRAVDRERAGRPRGCDDGHAVEEGLHVLLGGARGGKPDGGHERQEAQS